MSTLSLTLAYLRMRPLNTVLVSMLLALGMGTLTALLLLSRQTEQFLARHQLQGGGEDTRRVEAILELGTVAVRVTGSVLMGIAALGIFIALLNAMRERKGDLAIMRGLGASRGFLVRQVLTEGLLITMLGTAMGLALGHLTVSLLATFSSGLSGLALTGSVWYEEELWLIGIALLVGVVASISPALQAYRTDIARTLAEL